MPRVALIVLLVLLGGVPAAAAPAVEVHARTDIRMKPIRKDYDGTYVISGTLVDRFSGEPIGGELVELELGGQTARATTEMDGTFTMRVPAPDGRHDLRVEFKGSPLIDPAHVTMAGVDIDKNPVDLSITTVAEKGGVRITVTASAAGAPLQIPVDLLAGPADADKLAKAATITAGGPPFVLTRLAAGGPGTRHVRAVFAGDALYAPASADATVELVTATTTSLALRSGTVAYEDDVVATGKVLDDDGRGVARAPVALLDENERRIHTTMTDKDGAFRFRFEGRRLGQGKHSLQAIVEPTEGWMRTSRSTIAHVEIDTPQPVPIAYTLAAFALTALVAGGFFAARSKPWLRLRRPAPTVERERAPGEAPAEMAGGLVPARPSLVSTLRRPGDHGVAGVVRDAVRHRPLPGARIVIRLGEHDADTVAGPDGAFAIEGLMPGEWRAEVTCAGHVTERFSLTVPHRGELRGARVDLMPVRERIFSLYKRAALPLLPDPQRWGVWSPRQIFDHVRRRRPAAALAELTDFVEAAYFSARLPDEDVLPDAQQRVERALREQVV